MRTLIALAALCIGAASVQANATIPEGPEGIAFIRIGGFIVFNKIVAPKPLNFDKPFDFRTYHLACPSQSPSEEEGQFVCRQLQCKILSERPE